MLLKMSSSSGRFLSGAGSVEFVLFESEKDNLLDSGVPTAVLQHLILQCSPSSSTLVKTNNSVTDYASFPYQAWNTILLQEGDESKKMWSNINGKAPKSGYHIVVIDGLKRVTDLMSLHGLVHLLYTARSSQDLIVFASWLHHDDFEGHQIQALRSLATGIVQVMQRANNTVTYNSYDFEVSNELILRVARRKISGRLNVDVVTGTYDAENCMLIKCVVQKRQKGNNDSNGVEQVMKLNLPFNLGLSEKERMARAAVTLPFVHRDSSVADAGLVLHPQNLQVNSHHANEDSGKYSSESEDEEDVAVDEDGEELFSEDV